MKYNFKSIKRMKDTDLRDEAWTRYFLKGHYKTKPVKVSPSLQDDWHYAYDEDGEGWTEFGFFEANEMTDEEIDEAVEEMKIRPAFPAWDCSGLVFTSWITWYKNPCGWVSVIHRKSIDV